jgi:o-succinylbenzoate synthase
MNAEPDLDRSTYAVPLRTRFRGIDLREGMLLRGRAGWGEFSPFGDYDAATSVPWLQAALEAAEDGWPEPVRDRVPVNCTVPAVGPEHAAEIVRGSHGCTTAKVKVAERGQDLADDLARLEAVRDALGPRGRLRIDVNGRWSVDEAARAIARMGWADLEYVEQPCATVEELAELRRRVDVPIAADESIRRAEDPLRVVEMQAADVAVLKVQPLGGVRRCLRIAEKIDLPVVVSSALETSVGIAAGVALAAALPSLPYACGLATVSLLAHDVVDEPLVPVDGCLDVRRPEPVDGRLRADDATSRRWEERLRAVSGLLGPDRLS